MDELDRINLLPDPLICQILSHLPTKDAVRTSVLSTRWKSIWLWLWVPCFKLDSRDFSNFSDFVSFGDRFFDSNRVSYLDKVELKVYNRTCWTGTSTVEATHVKSWIDAAVVKCNIKHLRVKNDSYHDIIPISLFTFETLVFFKLTKVKLPNVELVSLPCLKTLHLKKLDWHPNEDSFERLVSSCPVLEELEIQGNVHFNCRVFSRSLKRLTIGLYFQLHVVIDAPRLSLLSIIGSLSESFRLVNMDYNEKLDLNIRKYMFFEDGNVESKRNRLLSFLPQISKVRDMIIHLHTFKLLCDFSKLEPLPQFCYMSRLQVELYNSYSTWLSTFLESFPNLKSLILVCYGDEFFPWEELNQMSFSSVPVPECLISSLEFVDIKVKVSGVGAAEMKLVRYFLENSAILKKITIPLDHRAAHIQDDFVKKVLKIQKLSTECKVVFL